ncbi:MAG: hypothetical protein GY870_02460, partial [archaeon]|nr:hypothetical protein [archaeon]
MPLLFNFIKKRYIKHAKKKVTLVTSTNQNNQIIQKIIQNINKTLIITGNTAWSSFQDYVNNFVEDGALLDYNSLYIPPNVDIS